jgi:DNA-binding transcriptional LysR family regulator
VDERRLQIFKTVAELNSFSRAAEMLHLAQPTVSQQVQALEEQVGARLLDRTNKSVSLTPAGRVMYAHALDLLRGFAEARRACVEAAGVIAGPLSIGASLTIGQYVLPRAVTALLQHHPGIQLNLAIHNTEQIAHLMLSGRLDIGLVEGPVDSSDLVEETLLEDELVWIAPTRHPWRQKDEITLDDLKAEPVLLREKGSGTRRVMEAHLREAGLPPEELDVVAEMDGIETIKGAVECGLGVAAVSRWTIRKELRLGTLLARTVRRVPMQRTFRAISPRGRTLLPAAAALLDVLRTVGQ